MGVDYILDFVCLEIRLVIEVDGGQHGQQTGYDENRTKELQAAGFCVLRFWNNEVPLLTSPCLRRSGFAQAGLERGGNVKKTIPP